MTFDTYLRILRDRLEEYGIDEEALQKTLEREKATVSGMASEEVGALFSEERLSVIVASTVRRSNLSSKSYKSPLDSTIDEQKNYASQGSLNTNASLHNVSSIEDKTIVPSHSSNTSGNVCAALPKALLETDTATVVISRSEVSGKTNLERESVTVVSPITRSTDIGKLFSESATVRISEKETLDFLVTNTEKTVILPFVPESVSVSGTDSDKAEPAVNTDDDTNLLPFIDKAYQYKKGRNLQNTNIAQVVTATSTVSESELKNSHPVILLLSTLFILFPCILFLTVVWSAIFLLGFLVLVTVTVFPVICYVLIVSFSGGGVLYSIYQSISFFMYSDTGNGFKAVGMTVIFLSVFVLSVMFLHRIVLPIYRYFSLKLRNFLRCNAFLCRNIYRSLWKNVKNI